MQRIWLSHCDKSLHCYRSTPVKVLVSFSQGWWKFIRRRKITKRYAVDLADTGLTTQQNAAWSRVDKGCPQICPKGLNVCVSRGGLRVCMSAFTWFFYFWSLALCVCVCVCVCVRACVRMRCLNSPLFSLLILAAAAGEAWANDDESKRLTWKPFSWSSRMKPNNEVLWHLKVWELNLRQWFIVVYCVAHLNFCRRTKK